VVRQQKAASSRRQYIRHVAAFCENRRHLVDALFQVLPLHPRHEARLHLFATVTKNLKELGFAVQSTQACEYIEGETLVISGEPGITRFAEPMHSGRPALRASLDLHLDEATGTET
jgi:hypothetical protein